ncbi:APC family permease [Maridesulfovibrio sp. FT414]|uniref:APC family permease n=1 Tax=Maridesulfovibrio sp. FT414 TaxID=2979469 RepID=UPI003D803A40
MSGLFTSLAVMMSPRGLEAVGNGAGSGGTAFLAVLALAAFAAICTSRNLESIGKGRFRATPADTFVFGFLDAARLFTLTLMAVSWLGIAGYAVNEIFFVWFPNLGASYVLLGLVVVSCIIADENGMDVFTICLTLAFCAFIYVMVMSSQPADLGTGYPTVLPALLPMDVPETLLASGAAGWLHLLFLGVFAFVGFDLPLAFENRAGRCVPSVLLGFVAFAVFSWVALLLVPAEKLAESTVPHLLVAREGLGELGRYLVGGTVVLVTVSGLLAFFMVAGKRIETVLAEDYRAHSTKGAAVLLAMVVALLLASGWAGEDALESLLSAGLCFWFGTYALADLLHLIGVRRAGGGILSLLSGLPVMLVHGGAAAFCSLHIQFPAHFYYSLGGMAVAGLVFGAGWFVKDRPLREELALAAAAAEELMLEQEERDLELEEAVPDTEDESLKIVDYK